MMSQHWVQEHPRDRFIRYCVQFSSIALVYYDYTLTWTQEVKFVWRRPFRLATVLYFACRYSMIANVIFALAHEEKLPRLNCKQGYEISASLGVAGRAAILITWGCRTYAMFNKNKHILYLFGALTLLITGVAAVNVRTVTCRIHESTTITENTLTALMVFYELLTAVLNSIKCYQTLREIGPRGFERGTLQYIIFEQGLTYCFVVTGLTIGSLVLLNAAEHGSSFKRLLNCLTLPISGLLTARFILHLRAHDEKLRRTCQDSSNISQCFASWDLNDASFPSTINPSTAYDTTTTTSSSSDQSQSNASKGKAKQPPQTALAQHE